MDESWLMNPPQWYVDQLVRRMVELRNESSPAPPDAEASTEERDLLW